MPGIYIAAVVASALALAIGIKFVRKHAAHEDYRLLIILFVLTIPMSALAFYGVRIPLDDFLADVLTKGSSIYRVATTFYAPFTEELAKLWPLIIPWVYARITKRNWVMAALALGIGFGIGEIWFLALRIGGQPEYTGVPWYYFGGFVGERLMVCILHAAFTATALRFVKQRTFVLGILAAMTLHYFVNFPIFLIGWQVVKIRIEFWGILLQAWLVGYLVAMIILLNRYHRSVAGKASSLFGTVHCKNCGVDFAEPWWGVNMGPTRYVRCPKCKKWMWT